jgi:hypothetical protein
VDEICGWGIIKVEELIEISPMVLQVFLPGFHFISERVHSDGALNRIVNHANMPPCRLGNNCIPWHYISISASSSRLFRLTNYCRRMIYTPIRTVLNFHMDMQHNQNEF